MRTVFDINKELRDVINKFNDTSEKNGVSIPILIEYYQLVELTKATCSAIPVMISDIVFALDNYPILDSLANISQTLDTLNSGLVKPKTLTIDSTGKEFYKTLETGNYNSIPNAMKGEITDTDMIPDSFNDKLKIVQSKMKESALQEALDSNSKLLLNSFVTLKNYIASTELINSIKMMREQEKFLLNPEFCARTKSELYFTGTRKYNSEYLLDLICMDLNGEILVGKIKPEYKSLSVSVNKILNKKFDFIN